MILTSSKKKASSGCWDIWCSHGDGALVTANYLNGRLKFRTHSHTTVLFSLQGSVWRDVIPYCIFNSIVTAIVVVCKRKGIYDFTFSDQGHSYISMLVSFLVVTRFSIAYKRYSEYSNLLVSMMESARELIQHTVLFTRSESHCNARMFRFEIARQIILMLRTVIYVLREEPDRDRLYLKDSLKDRGKEAISVSVGEASERSLNILVMFLRSTIASHTKKLRIPTNELGLLTNVSDFIRAYHEVMKLVNSPFPFPLVQMTRTLLFIWLFSLPFAIVDKMVTLLAPIIVMFFMTFGFLGLELISIAIDYPFGKHAISFDVLHMGKIVFDDIYINIHDVDGMKAKAELQKISEYSLAKAIKHEVRHHAKEFSRHQTWTSLDFPDTVEENKNDNFLEHDENKSEKIIEVSHFVNDSGDMNHALPPIKESIEEGVV